VALVTWNDALTDGRGHTGTRYGLCFEPPGDSATSGHWRINVDGIEICTVDSAEGALRRAEGLEAIRCIIRGLTPELTQDQLEYAEVIAREMMDAADQALSAAPISDRAQLLQSTFSLQSILDAMRKECARREREDGLPLVH